MEEADLLKERLQAITDKRRIQEDISRKRRQIEEEKLKLQYIKKKALREQWLMDGLSQQSEEEQEAMRLQAEDEQQQRHQLQTNILRIEKEVEELETQELNISANEELVLRRLKEVERTPEDIIKELNADVRPDVTHHVTSPLLDLPSCTSVRKPPVRQAEGEEPKRATFAMEISVELDKRTGRTQVVSAAAVTPETVEGRGLKVYDDGRKSVYELGGGVAVRNGAMTPSEVEELLRQATDPDAGAVQLHAPVYSAAYTGNTGSSSTPRTPSRRPTPTLSPAPTENQLAPTLSVAPPPSEAPPPSGSLSPARSERRRTPQCDGRGAVSSTPTPAVTAALVSVTARPGALPAATQPLYTAVAADTHNPPVKSSGGDDVTGRSPSGGVASLSLDESQPVTMIFMGYENAEDEDDQDVQAELVVIGNSDDDEDGDGDDDEGEGGEGAEPVAFHPHGYRSRVFRPPVGRATVRRPRDQNQDLDLDLDQDLDQLLRPTFTHKTRSGRGGAEMKLCSTAR